MRNVSGVPIEPLDNWLRCTRPSPLTRPSCIDPMDTCQEPPRDTRLSATTEGWFYVILALVPALGLQGAFEHWHRYRDPALTAMLAADALICLRALVGIVLGQKSKWWWLYCALYLLLAPISSWAKRIL